MCERKLLLNDLSAARAESKYGLTNLQSWPPLETGEIYSSYIHIKPYIPRYSCYPSNLCFFLVDLPCLCILQSCPIYLNRIIYMWTFIFVKSSYTYWSHLRPGLSILLGSSILPFIICFEITNPTMSSSFINFSISLVLILYSNLFSQAQQFFRVSFLQMP